MENTEIKQEKKVGGELADLKGLISELKEDIDEMKRKPKSSSVLRKRVEKHTAFLREFNKDDEVLGIVMQISDVREVKDPTEAKKYMGLCKLNVFNPKTNQQFVQEKVNYLEFLQNANRVKGLIMRDERQKRIETDSRKGGGGTGTLYRQDKNNSVVVEDEHEFEVEYEDHHYFLEIKEGAFKGYIVETDGTALNM